MEKNPSSPPSTKVCYQQNKKAILTEFKISPIKVFDFN